MKYRLVVNGPDSIGDVKVVLEVKRKLFGKWESIRSEWAIAVNIETDLQTQIMFAKESLTHYAKKHKMAQSKTVERIKV